MVSRYLDAYRGPEETQNVPRKGGSTSGPQARLPLSSPHTYSAAIRRSCDSALKSTHAPSPFYTDFINMLAKIGTLGSKRSSWQTCGNAAVIRVALAGPWWSRDWPA